MGARITDRPPLAALALTALLLFGCASDHLVYVQEVSLGFSVAIGTQGTQKVSLGYDRDIYAIVPTKNCNDASKCGGEAMSLLSINSVAVGGLNDLEVSEFIATGDPAVDLAKNPDAVNQLRNKIYGANP